MLNFEYELRTLKLEGSFWSLFLFPVILEVPFEGGSINSGILS